MNIIRTIVDRSKRSNPIVHRVRDDGNVTVYNGPYHLTDEQLRGLDYETENDWVYFYSVEDPRDFTPPVYSDEREAWTTKCMYRAWLGRDTFAAYGVR